MSLRPAACWPAQRCGLADPAGPLARHGVTLARHGVTLARARHHPCPLLARPPEATVQTHRNAPTSARASDDRDSPAGWTHPLRGAERCAGGSRAVRRRADLRRGSPSAVRPPRPATGLFRTTKPPGRKRQRSAAALWKPRTSERPPVDNRSSAAGGRHDGSGTRAREAGEGSDVQAVLLPRGDAGRR
jgi:hypothetical protein